MNGGFPAEDAHRPIESIVVQPWARPAAEWIPIRRRPHEIAAANVERNAISRGTDGVRSRPPPLVASTPLRRIGWANPCIERLDGPLWDELLNEVLVTSLARPASGPGAGEIR